MNEQFSKKQELNLEIRDFSPFVVIVDNRSLRHDSSAQLVQSTVVTLNHTFSLLFYKRAEARRYDYNGIEIILDKPAA